MVLSTLLYEIPAWHPDVTRKKEMEKLQTSYLRCVFGSKIQNEQQLKSYDILPVCYHVHNGIQNVLWAVSV